MDAVRGGRLNGFTYARSFLTGEINSAVADIQGALERLQRRYTDGKIDFLDGVTIQYPEWWMNVRASNTEPLLRLNVEAPDDATLIDVRDQVLRIVHGGAG